MDMDAGVRVNNKSAGQFWRGAGFSVAILLLLVLGLYGETTRGIWSQWVQWDGSYGHGFLVLGMSLYIVWRRRTSLQQMVPCPSVLALFAIAAFSLLWFVAALVDVQIVQDAVFLPLIWAVIWSAAGGRVAWKLLFPVLLIGLAIPVWFPLLPLLQSLTANVSFWLIRTAGVPALLDDFVVVLPAGSLVIAEACSGLHYLLAAVTLGVFYAYLNYRQLGSRLLVVLVAAGAAILANILRVFIVIYVAYTSDMQHPWVNAHFALGWYLFAGLIVVLLLVDLKRHHPTDEPANDLTSEKPVSAVPCMYGMWQRLALLVASISLVALGPALAWWSEHSVEERQDISLTFPESSAGWVGPSVTHDDWMPVYHGAIAEKRTYRKGAQELFVYLGYYPVQNQGGELISEANRVSDAKTWYSGSSKARTISAGEGTALEQVLVSSTGRQRLVWYWYQVAGELTTKGFEAKLLQLRGLVKGVRNAAVVVLATDVERDVEQAREVLNEFYLNMRQSLWHMANGESPQKFAITVE